MECFNLLLSVVLFGGKVVIFGDVVLVNVSKFLKLLFFVSFMWVLKLMLLVVVCLVLIVLYLR